MNEMDSQRSPSHSLNISGERLFTLIEDVRGAQRLFLFVLAACAYVCVAVGTTEQSQLLSGSAPWRLPVFNIPFSVISFHMVAPVMLLFLFVYFHSRLQRLFWVVSQISNVWEAKLLQNQGLGIWIVGELALEPSLPSTPPRYYLAGFRRRIGVFLVWLAVPITLTLIWLDYLLRHEPAGTSLHVIILLLAVGFGFWSYHLAIENVTPQKPLRFSRRSRLFAFSALFLGCAIFVCSFSLNAIYGPPSALTDVFAALGYKPYVHLAGKDLSAKPAGWTGENPEEAASTRGISFRGKNLRYANLAETFLVQADLRNADLTGANLKDANLLAAKLQGAVIRGADLQGTIFAWYDRDKKYLRAADFEGADLSQTNLEGVGMMSPHLAEARLREANLRKVFLRYADLRGADLQGADFRGGNFSNGEMQNANLGGADLRNADLYKSNLQQTQLQKANLQGASLEHAELVNADLRGAELTKTNLENADLQGADLTNTRGLTAVQIMGVFNDQQSRRQGGADNWLFARYSGDMLSELGLPQDHNQRLKDRTLIFAGLDLRGAKLRAANFRGVDLRKADLSHAILIEADLREADLRGANLREARMSDAHLEYADLRQAHLREASSINYEFFKGANVYDVADAPQGFFSKAIENGAVSIASDEEWNAFRKANRENLSILTER